MKIQYIIMLVLIISKTNAQQAQSFFPTIPGYKWEYKITPLDTLNKPIDTLSLTRIDSFLIIQEFENKLSNLVIMKTGNSSTVNYLPYTDTSYIHLETTNGWRFIKLINPLDTLQFIKGWYQYYRFAHPLNSQYVILSKDTTIIIDRKSYPLRVKVTGMRLSDQTVSVPAGFFTAKRFIITNGVFFIVSIPPFPPVEFPIVRIQDSTWIVSSTWIVKQFTPSTKVDLSNFGLTSFDIPGLKTELIHTTPVGITDHFIVPKTFVLFQNHPNPFNSNTTIMYQLPYESFATLKIINILGQDVSTLLSEFKKAGKYEVKWDASAFPSGVYFYRFQANSFSQTKKLLLIR